MRISGMEFIEHVALLMAFCRSSERELRRNPNIICMKEPSSLLNSIECLNSDASTIVLVQSCLDWTCRIASGNGSV